MVRGIAHLRVLLAAAVLAAGGTLFFGINKIRQVQVANQAT